MDNRPILRISCFWTFQRYDNILKTLYCFNLMVWRTWPYLETRTIFGKNADIWYMNEFWRMTIFGSYDHIWKACQCMKFGRNFGYNYVGNLWYHIRLPLDGPRKVQFLTCASGSIQSLHTTSLSPTLVECDGLIVLIDLFDYIMSIT